jgi:predicted Zn-dependent protease with MMP-like domain
LGQRLAGSANFAILKKYAIMQSITKKRFEILVKEAVEAIPKKFLDKLNNVDICVEDEPNSFQLQKLKMREGSLLFGLYEGLPQTKRRGYAQVLPDKITIFQKPIEKTASSEKEVKLIVKNTVWHEIAHHFGLSEEEVRRAERKRIEDDNK